MGMHCAGPHHTCLSFILEGYGLHCRTGLAVGSAAGREKREGFLARAGKTEEDREGGGHCPSVSEELGSGKPLGCRQRALHPSQNQSRASPRLSIQTGCEQALLCQIPAARMEESCGEEVGPGGG